MAVRREKVLLELEDHFSTGMAKAAAATALLDKSLTHLDGANVKTQASTRGTSRDIDGLTRSVGRADGSINQLTGRIRLYADAAAILGPSLVPLGGVAVAGVAGLASQLGFAAVAGGVLIGSMQDLGDALSALNDARLDPTVENLQKAEDALSALSPAAANFAREASGMVPILTAIRDAGAESLFPGLTASLDDLERLAPVVAGIFESVGGALGDIASGGAASLASERWAEFFAFIETEAPTAISELATTVGSLTHGLAELWMAFTPLNNDFSGWLMDVAAGFDSWATGLSQTEGFREFVDYIRETGPQVADTMGALANAVVQIVQAAAPLGGPTLAAIEGMASALAAIADTPVGPALLAAASGMALLSRATSVFNAAKAASLATLGPWGLAIAAGTAIFSAWSIESAKATAATMEFDAALQGMSLRELNEQMAQLLAYQAALGDDHMATDLINERIAATRKQIAAQEAANTEEERTARLLDTETDALLRNIAAMQAKRDEALRSFSAQTNYSQSLLDSKRALEDNGRAWNLNSDAGLANRRVVESQASAWNELNRTQGQTPAQARTARKALEDTAMSLGATREEARRYARQLLDIPNQLETKIDADVNGAMSQIERLEARLRNIADEDVFVNVRHRDVGGTGFGPDNTAADGTTVRDAPGPYRDQFLYALAPREEVVSNRRGQADRYRGALKAINADMPRHVIKGMLADGGTAGGDRKRRSGVAQFAPDNTGALEHAIDILTHTLEGQTRAVDEWTAKTDGWAAKMADVAQATVAGFNTDLFATSSNPWAKGASGGPFGNLSTDISGLQKRGELQAALALAGLDGDALAGALSQGTNADLSSLLASGRVQEFKNLYNQRAALQSSVGAAAEQQTFGAQYAAAAAEQRIATEVAQRSEQRLASVEQKLERTNELLSQLPEPIGASAAAGMTRGGNQAARRRRRDR